jgi:hypothetical protein
MTGTGVRGGDAAGEGGLTGPTCGRASGRAGSARGEGPTPVGRSRGGDAGLAGDAGRGGSGLCSGGGPRAGLGVVSIIDPKISNPAMQRQSFPT